MVDASEAARAGLTGRAFQCTQRVAAGLASPRVCPVRRWQGRAAPVIVARRMLTHIAHRA